MVRVTVPQGKRGEHVFYVLCDPKMTEFEMGHDLRGVTMTCMLDKPGHCHAPIHWEVKRDIIAYTFPCCLPLVTGTCHFDLCTDLKDYFVQYVNLEVKHRQSLK